MYFALLSNIFPPHLRGGYELGCQSIARALVRLGHRVEIITSASIGQLARAHHAGDLRVSAIFEPVFEFEESLVEKLKGSNAWRQRRDEAFGGIVVSNAQSLARFLADSRPDVLWMFNPVGLGPIGILEAALTQPLKCIIHLMDDVDGFVAQHQRSFFLEGRYRRLKSSISAISCSRKILSINEVAGGYRSHRVIYNGVDFDEVPCLQERVTRREEPCRFVYFGQVSEAKGLLHLLRAASSTNAKSFTIDVIGRSDSTFEKHLHREIATLGLREIVNVLGFIPREELLSRLTGYDAAILLLSNTEPFGYAPLEAAAAGLPVILTSGVGVAECFPKDYPLLVGDRSDSAEAASKLHWCILNRGGLRALGLHLRENLKVQCDFNSVVMPAYLRTIEACPVNEGGFDVDGLLSSYMTLRLYDQLRLAGRR
jgi:glycosyltransferase involved in cell wall biosynthesis